MIEEIKNENKNDSEAKNSKIIMLTDKKFKTKIV